MSESEAYYIIIEQLVLLHSFGESAMDRIDMWIGGSVGLIMLGYFAPERLKPAITAFILSLYSSFTYFIYENMSGDLTKGNRLFNDATNLAAQHNINMEIFDAYLEPSNYGAFNNYFFLGLFFGVIIFLANIGIKNYRGLKK